MTLFLSVCPSASLIGSLHVSSAGLLAGNRIVCFYSVCTEQRLGLYLIKVHLLKNVHQSMVETEMLYRGFRGLWRLSNYLISN